MIKKMTGLPANIIGMVDRGFIAEGMVADITVFDENTVIDKADFDNPKQYAEGIEHVLVNGQVALKDGELNGIQAGQALKRSYDMPSRPMSVDQNHRVKVHGNVENKDGKAAKVHLTIKQGKDDLQPKGSFNLIDKENNIHIKSTDLGLLQTYEGWASFVGTAKLNNSDTILPVIFKMDEQNPFTGDRTIDIQVDEYQYKGELNGKLDIE
ncbi:amidohydrolase family protein [Pseudalkalibacillus sp. A8]|uniref:amidohydrolase family protein n=1 Tax=Pseudalkalibacillus sp. A8 TaxID=3382641 RepID=UPI0038B66168